MSIYLDLFIVILLSVYLVKEKQLNVLNPCLIYLFFHVFFVTFKGIQIFFLGTKIISNKWYATYITLEEIDKAIFIADISLVAFFIGFNLFVSKFKNNGNQLLKKYSEIKDAKPKRINYYLIAIFVVGLIGIATYRSIADRDIEVADYSTFSNMMTGLGIISSIVLIYEKGFKKQYLIYFALLIVFYSLQGENRFRVILALLFVLMYYLKTINLKMPPFKYYILGFVFLLFSFPLKEVGKAYQETGEINFSEVIKDSFDEFTEGESGDMSFIEQSAGMIGAIDIKNKIFYGKTYESIFFFFVPRSLWPEKPILNQWQHDISITGRDFGEMGQISLISGEAYANFRYIGVFLISFFVGRWYSFLYNSYSNLPAKHKGFLLLLLFNMVLFQVWRDGMISLILFPFLNYLPIMILYFIKKPIPVK
jgi:hypothetical protein